MAVAAAWVPIRSHLPNTAVALILVLTVGVAGSVGGRWAVGIGTVAATLAFDIFDTAPYGQLLITRGWDVATAVALLVAGTIAGELCVRLKMYRLMAARRGADFAVMSAAAGLMAVGEDAGVIVRALAGELQAQLGLTDCEFEFGPPTGSRRCVSRDGRIVQLGTGPMLAFPAELDLPVWLGSDVVGRYSMTLGGTSLPSPDRLQVAAGIADQAGAALAGCRPDPQPDPPPGPSARRLHPVR